MFLAVIPYDSLLYDEFRLRNGQRRFLGDGFDRSGTRDKIKMKRTIVFLLMLMAASCSRQPIRTEDRAPGDEFLGRWDVTVKGQDAAYPSWFEISRNDGGLTGRFVGRVGSARPIQNIQVDGDRLNFSLPVQYETNPEDIRFEAWPAADGLQGTTNAVDGSSLTWTAVQAPTLERTNPPVWGEPIELLSGNLDGQWHARSPEAENHWTLSEGVLSSSASGTDLVTDRAFEDFKLHIDFKYPEGSNSGVYLRGRYEVQIQDDYGKEPTSVLLGGVYGFLTPAVAAGKPAGEWQSYDITLLGRRITVVLNGQTIIDDKEIPGITGGALDSDEGAPGPIMLQGDHGPISFRNIVLTPAQ